MSEEDRRLYTECIAAMRELRGELREFKEHVLSRVNRLEANEGKRGQVTLAIISVIIAACAMLAGFASRFVR